MTASARRIRVVNPNSNENVTRGLDDALAPLRFGNGPAHGRGRTTAERSGRSGSSRHGLRRNGAPSWPAGRRAGDPGDRPNASRRYHGSRGGPVQSRLTPTDATPRWPAAKRAHARRAMHTDRRRVAPGAASSALRRQNNARLTDDATVVLNPAVLLEVEYRLLAENGSI